MEELEEQTVWMSSTREEILAADRADATHRIWQGKRIIGFRRWVGMDNYWHAVLVLEDHTHLLLVPHLSCASALSAFAAGWGWTTTGMPCWSWRTTPTSY
jgi:hypothetical protein